MSRIGNKPITIPSGVDIKINGAEIAVKGAKATLMQALPAEVTVKITDGSVIVEPANDSKRAKAMWGLSRSLISNMVEGVTKGYHLKLEMIGVGYRAAVQGQKLTIALGYSHPIDFEIPKGIEIKCPKQTEIEISGADKQVVGQVAAKIKRMRRADPYKGKGIYFVGEHIRRKEGKKK